MKMKVRMDTMTKKKKTLCVGVIETNIIPSERHNVKLCLTVKKSERNAHNYDNKNDNKNVNVDVET